MFVAHQRQPVRRFAAVSGEEHLRFAHKSAQMQLKSRFQRKIKVNV